jgi:hypothetical protein
MAFRFTVVYPDGSRDDLVGVTDINVGDLVGGDGPRGGIVAYMTRLYDKPTVAYLDPINPDEELRKVVFFVVNGASFPITIREAALLRDALRLRAGGDVGHPATAAAVRIEQLIEEPPGESPRMEMTDAEEVTLRHTIEEMVIEGRELPERLMDLRYGLLPEES